MDQFPVLLRKDHTPIRYLVVDDSVFARKNVAKMVESFGGEIVGEAGDGCTAIQPAPRFAQWIRGEGRKPGGSPFRGVAAKSLWRPDTSVAGSW